VDSDQLRAAKAGDSAALNRIARWFTDELLAFYGSRVPRETARELTQQSAEDLIAKFASAPEQVAEFRSWVRRFGVITERRWRRKVVRYGQILAQVEDQAFPPARGLESQLGECEERALMTAAIDELSSPYRSTIRLSNARPDARARELAAELGVAEATVRWRLMVARERLDALVADKRVTQTPYRRMARAPS
jgi:DNA-directed RNA polymerase specialized sigma24 family protein